MTRNTPVPHLSHAQKDRIRSWLTHEDDAVLVFNKPAGVPVQTRGNRGESIDHLLWAFAKSNGKRPRLVHRIDAQTSGVIIVARTQPAAAFLSAEFSERRARKTYLALVRGDIPKAESGVIDASIARRPGERGGEIAKIVAEDATSAKSARTAWRVITRSEEAALIEARPETGRMHQIRVHLAHLGCPILGDPIYGVGKLSAARCMLHALRLELSHPDGTDLDLHASLPEDFLIQAEKVGLNASALEAADTSS